MPASKPALPHTSADRYGETDFAKLDAHVITQDEYDEIPELTDAWMAEAEFYIGDRFVRVGPPGTPQGPVKITLLPAIVDHFRAAGPGWQARVNAILMEVVRREGTAAEPAETEA